MFHFFPFQKVYNMVQKKWKIYKRKIKTIVTTLRDVFPYLLLCIMYIFNKNGQCYRYSCKLIFKCDIAWTFVSRYIYIIILMVPYLIIYLTKSLSLDFCIVSRILLFPLTFEDFAISITINIVNIHKCKYYCAHVWLLP